MNDLESRCLRLAKTVRDFCKAYNGDKIDSVYIRQIVRSSSSIGANYIEANEKLGPKDLIMKLKIARKEAKETMYWLELLDKEGVDMTYVKQETEEIRKILSAIINKVQLKQSA